MMTTGLLYDSAFLDHDTGMGHPESSARLKAISEHLAQHPRFNSLKRLTPRVPDLSWIETVHDHDYIKRAQRTCASGNRFLDSMDVSVCARSYDVALLAAGAAMVLADQIVDGTIDNGFAMLRPPGHHAERDQALGFCLFNNVAIVARYLQRHHGLDKLLILDWDVHHGNGTQHTFEDDPSVLYVSTHQYPYYPGTGADYETGLGRGVGATLNYPMAAGASDQDYEFAFQTHILPRIDAFKPEAIIISAGFDAHADDPLGGILLSAECYAWMTERLMEAAEKHAGGRILSFLEGGYHLTALSQCVAQHLDILNTAAPLEA